MNHADFITLDKIPKEPVPSDYKMDPETEDLILGNDLHLGDIVLLFNPELRRDAKKTTSWCQIETYQIERTNYSGEPNILVRMIVVLPDGRKNVLAYNVTHPWLVKTPRAV